MNRRSLLLGLGTLIAAPAIVRAESLMKIVVPKPVRLVSIDEFIREQREAQMQAAMDAMVYGQGWLEYGRDGHVRALDPWEMWNGKGVAVDSELVRLEYPFEQFDGLINLGKTA